MKYYHRDAGAKFLLQVGTSVREISFAGGEFDTSTISDEGLREYAETELRKVADIPASRIFTKQAVAAPEEAAVAGEVLQSATAAFDAHNHVPPGAQTVAMPQAQQLKPTLNQQGAAGNAEASGGSLADQLAKAKASITEHAKK